MDNALKLGKVKLNRSTKESKAKFIQDFVPREVAPDKKLTL